MEEEPDTSVEEEEFEEEERRAKARGKLLKIIAIVVVLAVAGVAVWLLFLSNQAPVASFTYEPRDRRLSVNAEASRDPDGTITSYHWDWGDNTAAGTRIRDSHNYTQDGDYTVTLTVADSRGAAGVAAQVVHIELLPTAIIEAAPDRMSVTFDGSSSFIQGGTITAYSWDFGDGTPAGMGAIVSHTYATPGRRNVTLTVTDSQGRQGTASRFVSPADSTVDVVVDQMLQGGCPWGDWWDLRYNIYGDTVLRLDSPCTLFYPWVLFTGDPENNPSWVYSIYRERARVRNHPGYNLSEPVMLPVFNRAVAPAGSSYLAANLTFDYVDTATWDLYATGPFAMSSWVKSDGFGYLVKGNLTMDLTTSKRIFGVVGNTAAEAQTWWYQNTQPARNAGTLETAFSAWLANLGNTKYDIYNAFEWYYQTDITDLNATVSPDGTTRVSVFWTGWGYEILLSRWFYWGNASYRNAVCVAGIADPTCPQTLPYGAIQPAGWAPIEYCWCEQVTLDFRLEGSLDLDFVGYIGYHISAAANWGPDGRPATSDDLPSWVFEPLNVDYVPREGSGSTGSQGYPNSELRFFEGRTSVINSPGSFAYGEAYEYLVTPTRWRFGAGSTFTLRLPTFQIPWYDPVRSFWQPGPNIGSYVTFMAGVTVRMIEPAGTYYIWDARGKVLSFAGPHDWGVPASQVPPFGWPRVELGPEA